MSIERENLDKWKHDFNNNSNNLVMQNIISSNSLRSLYTNRNKYQNYNHLFSNTVKPNVKITNQKSSGRCWMFAALNVVRRPFMEKYNLKDFEFSQSYLFFWDKLERFNYLLECILDTKEKDINDQTVQYLLKDPTCDGGQWDMFVNLVEKYGLVPKSCFNESYYSSSSSLMNAILKKKFREYALKLRNSENPKKDKQKYLQQYYNLLCKFMGTPPNNFSWEYVDSKDEFKKVSNLTPLDFYKNMVPFNYNDYICVVSDPRKENKFNKLYTVKYLGNVIEGNKVKYLNLPIKELKNLTIKSINNNEAVWYGCDVGKWLHRDQCSMDLELVNYSDLLGTTFSMNKEERLLSGDSLMTHAMVITGYNKITNKSSVNDNNETNVDKWQVENSWSNKGPANGFYVMTDDWFNEYTFEVVVNKKYLNDNHKKILDGEVPIELKPWDPMGSLAKN
jgi:bleomycin hydrolase